MTQVAGTAVGLMSLIIELSTNQVIESAVKRPAWCHVHYFPTALLAVLAEIGSDLTTGLQANILD